MKPLWKTVWKSLKKLKIEQPYNTAILLLDSYLKKMKTIIWKDRYTPIFITALLTIAEIWKQPKYLSIKMDKEDMRSTHTHTHITQFDRKIEENVFIIEKIYM